MANEDAILQFFALLEKEVTEMNYGTLTVNTVLKEGTPELSTVNIVKSKRKKYNPEGITAIQVGVAELLAEGLTN